MTETNFDPTRPMTHVIDRQQAVHALANQYGDRTAYLVAAPADVLPSIADQILPNLPWWVAFLDQGGPTVLVTNIAPVVAMTSALIRCVAVISLPKAGPITDLIGLLGSPRRIGEDGDLILVRRPDDPDLGPDDVVWPILLIDAIDEIDPMLAARIRSSGRWT